MSSWTGVNFARLSCANVLRGGEKGGGGGGGDGEEG